MKRQRVVRTFPRGYTSTTEKLSKLLEIGYSVVMCNAISVDGKEIVLEYIVEKEIEDE
jgi:hypothetical protein